MPLLAAICRHTEQRHQVVTHFFLGVVFCFIETSVLPFRQKTLNGIKTRETFRRLSAKTATCLSFKQTFFDYVY